MTAKRLREILKRTGITQRAAAKRIGISERQMRRYVAGTAKIPVVIDICINSMVIGWMEKNGIDYLAKWDESLAKRVL